VNVRSGSSRDSRRPEERPLRQGILVLVKVNAVLDALADLGAAGPSEIAARIGANKSTTFRLVNSMERIGLLDRAPNGTYALGLRLMELGALVEGRLDLRRIADPELVRLQRDLSLTAFLTVRHHFQATCVDRISGTNVDILALRLGGILPLHAGAGPRVLLAGMPEPELSAYLERAPFQPLTPSTLILANQLLADVAETRRRGYVVSIEDVTIGVAALGVPVYDASGQIAAAISVAGLRQEFEDERETLIAKRVREAAVAVSASLGAPSGLTM
jgi:DNA-binding IclR family transcriptional regulator